MPIFNMPFTRELDCRLESRSRFANKIGDFSTYLQANLDEAAIFSSVIPWRLEYDFSCAALGGRVDVGLAFFHHSFQFASSGFWMTVHEI